ncbi:MAG TPA: hypothetical protein VFA26_05325 [Gemmataceae bacterium]|nr:hypothetical protein [Gemmataceae bacterium]
MARRTKPDLTRRLADGRRCGVGCEQTHVGADYSDEEREFIQAMERYRRLRRRPFPTCREVLEVLRSLGYRKVARTRRLP